MPVGKPRLGQAEVDWVRLTRKETRKVEPKVKMTKKLYMQVNAEAKKQGLGFSAMLELLIVKGLGDGTGRD